MGELSIRDYVDQAQASTRREIDSLRAEVNQWRAVMQEELNGRYQAMHTDVDRRFLEAKSAAQLATGALDKRLEAMNELRQQIASERGQYATKEDLAALGERFNVAHKPVLEFMAAQLARVNQEGETRHNRYLSNGQIIATAGVAVTIVVAVLYMLVGHRV
jgi:hypothetical protein